MSEEKDGLILVVDDDPHFLRGLSRLLKSEGYQVIAAETGEDCLNLVEREKPDLVFLDVMLPDINGLSLLPRLQENKPDLSVVMMTAKKDMDIVIQALRLGATDFLKKDFELLELDAVLEKSIRYGSIRQKNRSLRDTIRGIQQSENTRIGNRTFVGVSSATRQIHEQIKLAVDAKCDTILITGETGTGKEVVAREIHFQAGSEGNPFIPVSCPAIPDTLIESELFGHVKGAFTGATADRAGSFELADGGTLFLDEVGDLSPPAQAKLLRVLETRNITRVGGSKEIKVSVRVISATNAPLEKFVKEQKFRSDLFYRLNVYSINLPPLRERRADIIPLAKHFLSLYAEQRSLHFDGFSQEAENLLVNYDFPGNARELRNIVERAAILCQSGKIQTKHLNLSNHEENSIIPEYSKTDDDQERIRILKALEEAKWNRSQAARNLGISYSRLRYRMQKFGIS
jgi:DNA-binding NtrC family response regulator